MADDNHVLNLKVKVDADTKQLTVVDDQLNNLNQTIDKSGKSSKGASAGLGEMGGAVNELMSPLGAGAGAFTSVAGAVALVGATIVAGISKWEEEKKLNREVAGVVNGLGLNYDSLKGSINANLDAIKANTKFTDEQAKKAFTSALKYPLFFIYNFTTFKFNSYLNLITIF